MECGQSKGTFELICQLALSLHLQNPVLASNDAFNELNLRHFEVQFTNLLYDEKVGGINKPA